MSPRTFSGAGSFQDSNEPTFPYFSIPPQIEGDSDPKDRVDQVEPVDLRSTTEMLPIRDQESTATCSAFALAGLIEHSLLNAGHNNLELAVGWMHSCIGGEILSNSVHIDLLATGLLGRKIPSVSNDYPNWEATDCEREGKFWFPQLEEGESANDIKIMLAHGQPIATGMVFTGNFEHWKTDLPYEPTVGEEYWEHAILVVGFDETCWICRNSYGVGWGDKGYFRVPFGNCALGTGIFRAFSTPVGFASSLEQAVLTS